jgi:hypothetical protein
MKPASAMSFAAKKSGLPVCALTVIGFTVTRVIEVNAAERRRSRFVNI